MSTFTLRNYDHDGVLLNVSGERDEDECQINHITAADSEIDIFDIFQPRTVSAMARMIDAQLCREARSNQAVARAEAHQWHREFAIA